MAKLINKMWWYKPNGATTVFTLTVTYADGTSSVYIFNRNATSWSPSEDGDHDDRILIYTPDIGGSFRVRAYENDVPVKISAVFSNATGSANARDVDFYRIHFPYNNDEFDITDVYLLYDAPTQYYAEWSMWDMFDKNNLGDIVFTSKTPQITLPNFMKGHSVGKFNGWCVLDDALDNVKVNYPGTNKYQVYASWYHRTSVKIDPNTQADYNTWPIVLKVANNDSYEGLDKLMERATETRVFRAIPIGYHSGVSSFIKTN